VTREAENSSARANWAVFGGSFDPPHVGHVLVAAYVLGAHGIERVLVTPTAAHAFGKKLASFEDRSKMCELAFAPLRSVELCTIERELPSPSYTLHTLQALAKRFPDVQLRLLVGSDLKTETHAWHDFESITKLAPPLWIARQGSTPLPGEPMMPDISSTEVRRRIAAGESTAGLLSPAVADYIRDRALYQ
jgi:nicotinate-nucleotide adenylyltransferase